MIRAAGRGNVEIVQHLLARPGVDVNYRDEEGYTALTRAAENGNFRLVDLLLYSANLGDLVFVLKKALESNKHYSAKLVVKRILAKHPVLCMRMGLDEEQRAKIEIIFSQIRVFRRKLAEYIGRGLPIPIELAEKITDSL